MTVLVTGTLGYIGSHCTSMLKDFGISFIGLDNLHTGLMENNHGPCVISDIRNKKDLQEVFKEYNPEMVMHFAALTSVPESMKNKDEYIEVNTEGTEILLQVMKEFNCNKLIFSSTASIYRQSREPLKETDPAQPLNNYALTKYWAEDLIKRSDWLDYIIFRYFNVIGYEDWFNKEHELSKTNLVPALIRAKDLQEPFEVYGNRYPVTRENSKDHTCVRDYIDVRDIAKGHLLGAEYLAAHSGCRELFNLGTKQGSSVLEILDAFNKANGTNITYTIEEPRKGDPASLIADNRKAREILHWSPEYTLEQSLKM